MDISFMKLADITKMVTSQEFLDYVKAECRKHKIKVLFPRTKNVNYPGDGISKVSGYFDEDNKTLACALGKPTEQWLSILVHEFNHMQQSIEKAKVWTDIETRYYEYGEVLDSFLNGKKYPSRVIKECIRRNRDMELDCEIRSVDMIRYFGLNINVEEYIKQANSYVYFYTVMGITKRWCDKPPYAIREIVECMPTKFLKPDEYNYIDKDLINLYKEKCYK